MALTPAVFLDKDGTLLEDVPYNVAPEHMRLARGAREGLRMLGRLGLPLIVVSNQPGVALGHFDTACIAPMAARLSTLCEQAGAPLSGFYWCPHHPQGRIAAYARRCACRKPAPGMLLRAAREHGLDLRRSWMVGDILDDIEAGHRAGCRSVLLDNGGETLWQAGAQRTPTQCVPDLAAAAAAIVATLRAEGMAAA
ncbi:D-glycero-alpha-D-manno-heptose-1,7-bisphosphate 7-phosphatase [Bordetella genomosp. 6]|uniref:D-glycero-alpha-D-manno-heptose-1,7-bisphosphate 7-phosphatase n=1 Tax=Bordetella genomosp. 6 TaxID=463024 RepID=UPI000A296143|nr:HAD family hydrolase [Bordetella genomosp. 6]ARP76492.1 HAD family hydrolase [Bordetella genomosp. 6]